MTYARPAQVLPFVRTLRLNTGTTTMFDMTTIPTITDVEMFLDAGYAKINAELESRGYTAPIGSTATCYNEAVLLEALYAAAWVYQTRMVQGGGTPEVKGNVLMQQFENMLGSFLARDLSMSGVTHNGYEYAGGVSVSDKADVESDTDREPLAFKRGVHDTPGIDWGKGRTTSAS